MKKLIFIFILICAITAPAFAQKQVKQPDLAGSWYPSDPAELTSMLSNFLNNATPKEVKGDIIALISPHAGYVYSGGVAAYGFKLLQDRPIETVIVIGFSHKKFFDGISVYKEGFFRTPLGDIEIDSELTSKLLLKNPKIVYKPDIFSDENSLEMQLPFLQKVLAKFKLVPIIIGERSFQGCQILSDALTDTLKDRQRFVIIASTDLCHFLSYEENKKIDLETIEFIKKMDAKKSI